jgi:hypothetical protein
MAKLTFYRQVRPDNAARTVLAFDNVLKMMHYTPGSDEPDPALS